MEITKQADELYSQRQQIQNVRASVALLESSGGKRDDYEIRWRLGRALFFLGQEAADKNSAFLSYSQGIDVCEQAVATEAGRVEGRFWLAVNLALMAQLKGGVVAIRHARRAMRELQRAIQIDSSYHAAGPVRVLARMQHKLPRWIGGSVKHARANYQTAVTLAEDSTVTRIYFAELLLAQGQQDLARAQLEFVLNVREDEEWAFEIERDKRIAKDMLARLEQPV